MKEKRLNNKKYLWFINFTFSFGGADLNDLLAHLRLSKMFGFYIDNLVLPKEINSMNICKFSKCIQIHKLFKHKHFGKSKLLKPLFYFYDGINNMLKLFILFRNQNWGKSYYFFEQIYPYWLFFSIFLLMFPKLRGRFTIHIHFLPNDRSLFSLINLKFLNYVFKRAKYVVVTEEVNKMELLKRFSSISYDKIIVLPIFPPYFFKEEVLSVKKVDKFKDKYGYRRGDKIIFFPGQLRIEKGIIDYLHALKKLQIFGGVSFVFAGGYSSKEKHIIASEIESAKKVLGNNLVFHNIFLSDEEYHCLIKFSDFVVLPYRQKSYLCRGSGVIYDCVMNKTPFIAPDFGVFSYYVRKYGIGLLYPVENVSALSKTIEDAISGKYNFKEGFKEAKKIFYVDALRIKYYKVVRGD